MSVVAFGAEWRMWDAVQLREAFICLYITSALIYVRNLYRIVNYASPTTSDIVTHEAYFIVFEGVSIFVCFVIYSAFHFGRVLPRDPEAYVTPGLIVNVKEVHVKDLEGAE